jgi:hypothetical protein
MDFILVREDKKMKKQLKIVGLAVLLLAFILNGCFISEGKVPNRTTFQNIKNLELIDEKSVGLTQPLIGNCCEYLYGVNTYPGPEEIFYVPLANPSEYNSVSVEFPGSIFGGSTYGCDDIWYVTGENGTLFGIDVLAYESCCIGGGGVEILALAYDPINYTMYGGSNNSYLYKIDQYTGDQEQIGPFGGDDIYMDWMTFDRDGVLYGQDQEGILYTINTETGEATPYSIGISINSFVGVDFCRETDTFYVISYVTTGQLYELDLDTGECTLIGTIGSGIGVACAMIPNNCTWFPRSPEAPTITGPNKGVMGQDYNFTVVATDPDGDDISYFIDWGDGKITETKNFWSGKVVTLNHTWNEKGAYLIKGKAIDEYGLESNWSEFEIIIPRYKATFNNIFQWFFKHFPILERILFLIRPI